MEAVIVIVVVVVLLVIGGALSGVSPGLRVVPGFACASR